MFAMLKSGIFSESFDSKPHPIFCGCIRNYYICFPFQPASMHIHANFHLWTKTREHLSRNSMIPQRFPPLGHRDCPEIGRTVCPKVHHKTRLRKPWLTGWQSSRERTYQDLEKRKINLAKAFRRGICSFPGGYSNHFNKNCRFSQHLSPFKRVGSGSAFQETSVHHPWFTFFLEAVRKGQTTAINKTNFQVNKSTIDKHITNI